MDGEVSLKDEVAAVLDLGNGVEPGEIHRAAFAAGELRTQDERPVVEPRPDDLWAQPVGGGLEHLDIVHGQEGVVMFAEADVMAVEFALDEGMPVEVVGGLERKEGSGSV